MEIEWETLADQERRHNSLYHKGSSRNRFYRQCIDLVFYIMLNWCSRISCVFKKMTLSNKLLLDSASEDADLFEISNEESESDIAVEEIQVKQEPIEINIHNPIYEYAHGRKFSSPPIWLVVHYTACIDVGAKSMCKAMKNNTSASSHFYIDEKDIYSAVPLKYIAWHVGNGKVKQPKRDKEMTLEQLANYKASDWRYDLAANNHIKWVSDGNDFKGNSCSLGVDICVKKKSSASKKATDNDWYFEEKAVDNAAKTVAYLANLYKIDDSHIIRHCDATGKLCPSPYSWTPEVGDREWKLFKTRISEYRECGVIVKFV